MLRAQAILLSAVACLSSCDKSKDVPKGKVEGLAKSAVDMAPSDTQVALGFNWGRFKESKYYDDLLNLMRKDPENAKKLETMQQACGMDVLRELDSVVVTAPAFGDDRTLVFVKGNWDQAKANQCVVALAKNDERTVTAEADGSLTKYVEGDGKTLYAWWSAPDTAVVAPVKAEDKTILEAVAKGDAKLAATSPLRDVLSRTDTTAMVWVAMPIDEEMRGSFKQSMEGIEANPQSLFGSLNLTSDLKATIGVRFANESEAAAVTKKGQQELEGVQKDQMYGKYLAGVSIAQNGSDVIVNIALSEAQLREIGGILSGYADMIGKQIQRELIQ
jgi:hypothetical protein